MDEPLGNDMNPSTSTTTTREPSQSTYVAPHVHSLYTTSQLWTQLPKHLHRGCPITTSAMQPSTARANTTPSGHAYRPNEASQSLPLCLSSPHKTLWTHYHANGRSAYILGKHLYSALLACFLRLKTVIRNNNTSIDERMHALMSTPLDICFCV